MEIVTHLRYNYIMRKTLTIKQRNFEYYEAGDGEPLVIIPGAFSSWRLFLPIINKLSKHYHVVCLTLPNMGQSSSFNRVIEFDEYLSISKLLISRIFAEQQISLVGHSMGGGIVLNLAQDKDLKIKKVVAINPLLKRFENFYFRTLIAFSDMFIQNLKRLQINRWLPKDIIIMMFRRPSDFVRIHRTLKRFRTSSINRFKADDVTVVIDVHDRYVLANYENELVENNDQVEILKVDLGGHNFFLFDQEKIVSLIK